MKRLEEFSRNWVKNLSEWQDDWQKAKRFFNSSLRNLNLGDVETAANRLYFSGERAAVAWLKKNKVSVPPDHQQIWFLSKKIAIPTNSNALLRELYDLRLQADYGKRFEIAVLNKETVKNYLSKTRKLLEEIEKSLTR